MNLHFRASTSVLYVAVSWLMLFDTGNVSCPRVSAQIVAPEALAKRVAAARVARKPDASDEFFKRGEIPRLKIEIPKAELDQLRQNNRAYVRCKIIENDKTEYANVAVKLKGAAGSFRGVDDQPALTINFDKFRAGQRFHDLDKIHLNNSVQDPTYLNELICSELFLAAGVPTPRTTHARVWLNGRDLGLYVLKEGFDKTFLKRHFKDPTGNLYDGGFVQDIDADLEKDSGDGPDDRSDLKALVASIREPDAAKRFETLEALVDVDQFITFMAVELMCAHWDGYCNNRNNYRVYFDPSGKRFHFFPHGMDQMFGDPNASVLHTPGALVAQAIMSNPEWRARYRDRLAEVLPMFSPPDKLLGRIDELHRHLRPVLASMGADYAREHDVQVRHFKELIVARAKSLAQQSSTPEPRPLKFDAKGAAAIVGWQSKSESPDAKLEELREANSHLSYAIQCGPSGHCVASWRRRVLLPAGVYKLTGNVRTAGVEAIDDGPGSGAGVRISGGRRMNKLAGDSKWQTLEYAFEINGAVQEVELVAELRASKGTAWFDAASLQIVRLKK